MRSSHPMRSDETALNEITRNGNDADAGIARFERLARKVRRAGLVWAQAEPSHVRWSLNGDALTTLVAESPWIRRRVDELSQAWLGGAPAPGRGGDSGLLGAALGHARTLRRIRARTRDRAHPSGGGTARQPACPVPGRRP